MGNAKIGIGRGRI